MSNDVRDVTNEYRLADKAAAAVDFAKEYPVQDISRLIRAAWIHGYAAALLQHPNGSSNP
jgi:hypothetical protein